MPKSGINFSAAAGIGIPKCFAIAGTSLNESLPSRAKFKRNSPLCDAFTATLNVLFPNFNFPAKPKEEGCGGGGRKAMPHSIATSLILTFLIPNGLIQSPIILAESLTPGAAGFASKEQARTNSVVSVCCGNFALRCPAIPSSSPEVGLNATFIDIPANSTSLPSFVFPGIPNEKLIPPDPKPPESVTFASELSPRSILAGAKNNAPRFA